MSASVAGRGRLSYAAFLIAVTLQPSVTINCQEQAPGGHLASGGSASAPTIVRSTAIEKALDDLRARFPNRVVVGFEELVDERPEAEPQVDLGPNDSSLQAVLNRVRKLDPRYRIELLKGRVVHVYPAYQTADPAGLLDIRLKEFSMPQDSCLQQAIRYIDERFHWYAPELVRFLDQRKERWYRRHQLQMPGVVGNILGDCIGSAAPGPAYRNITVREALDRMAERSLQVSRGEVTSNSPVHPPYEPLSWGFRFRRDADSDTGLGGIPVFETF